MEKKLEIEEIGNQMNWIEWDDNNWCCDKWIGWRNKTQLKFFNGEQEWIKIKEIERIKLIEIKELKENH